MALRFNCSSVHIFPPVMLFSARSEIIYAWG